MSELAAQGFDAARRPLNARRARKRAPSTPRLGRSLIRIRLRPSPLVRERGPEFAPCCPELRRIATQVFAEIGLAKCSVIAGDAHVEPNREIRVSPFRQPGCRRPICNHIAGRSIRGGRLPCRTERRRAARQPLVLPPRSCHQTSLLVFEGRARQGFAARSVEFFATRKAGLAASRCCDATFGRECPCRTHRTSAARRAGYQPRHAAGRCECGSHAR